MELQNLKKEQILDYLKQATLQYLADKWGYQLQSVDVSVADKITPHTKYSLTFSYKNVRLLKLSLVDYYESQTLFLIIRNMSTEKQFQVAEYLRNKHLNTQDIFKLVNHEGEQLNAKLQNFFKALDSAMDNDLRQVLAGDKWIDLPTEWHGYR